MNWNEFLEYKDGNLYWRERVNGGRSFNTTYAGKKVGCLHKQTGYVMFTLHEKRRYAHRAIWEMHNREIPKGMEIDHIDGVRHNNNIENLRLVDRTENSKNTSKRADNTSGSVGVYLTRAKKWAAQIGVNKNVIPLGTFTDKNEAIAARKAAEVKYGFHQNHGRS